jgi:hypothetical protein
MNSYRLSPFSTRFIFASEDDDIDRYLMIELDNA